MYRFAKKWRMLAMLTAIVALLAAVGVGQSSIDVLKFPNTTGVHGTFSTAGPIDTSGPFFQPLGQRFATTCEHCHFASDAWGISAATASNLFNSTAGQHPLFS